MSVMEVVMAHSWEAVWQLWPQLALFIAVLLFFHSSEFLLAAVFMREGLSRDCEFGCEPGFISSR